MAKHIGPKANWNKIQAHRIVDRLSVEQADQVRVYHRSGMVDGASLSMVAGLGFVEMMVRIYALRMIGLVDGEF